MSKKSGKDCEGGEDCRDERHLCKISGQRDYDLVRELVRDARYFCRKCGRATHNASNLCKPSDI